MDLNWLEVLIMAEERVKYDSVTGEKSPPFYQPLDVAAAMEREVEADALEQHRRHEDHINRLAGRSGGYHRRDVDGNAY